jgi:hypothetical protein
MADDSTRGTSDPASALKALHKADVLLAREEGEKYLSEVISARRDWRVRS